MPLPTAATLTAPEILACEQANITVTLPKPMTSGAKAHGRFGKQDFAYLPTEDVYRCPAGNKLSYRYTNEENGRTLRHYWTGACRHCALKSQCAKEPERRIKRWEHEHVLEAVQQRVHGEFVNLTKTGQRGQFCEPTSSTVELDDSPNAKENGQIRLPDCRPGA
jgi:hypothetical protein